MESAETFYFKVVSPEGCYPMGILFFPNGEPFQVRNGKPCIFIYKAAKQIAREQGYEMEVGR